MFYSYYTKKFLNFKKEFAENDAPRLAKEVYPDNVTIEEFSYIDDGNEYHKFNLYKLKEIKAKKPLIIDIHGGAWVYGTKELKKGFCMEFSTRGYDVLAMNYRLIDDVVMKDIIKDIFDCLNYVDENYEKLGISLDNVYITGDSAGGHLALVVSKILYDEHLANELGLKIPNFKVKASLLNHAAPYTNIIGQIFGQPRFTKISIEAIRRLLYGKNYKKDLLYKRLGNPETYINKDTKLPKLFVLTSKGDCAFYYQSEMLYNLFKENNVDFEYFCCDDPLAGHVYNSMFPHSKIGKQANDMIDIFFKNN